MGEKTAENQEIYDLDQVNEAAVNVLRKLRKAKGYDVEELAGFTDIPADRLCDIEALPVPATAAELYVLGKELGISIEVFFIMLVDD